MRHSTSRLRFTPVTAGTHRDAASLFAALDDPKVGMYLGGPDAGSLQELHDWIDVVAEEPETDPADDPAHGPAAADVVTWRHFIVRTRSGKIAGRVEATVHPGWIELGYVLTPSVWGRGYGTEAAGWLVALLREQFPDHTLWAAVDPRNTASVAVLRKLGFRQVRRTKPLLSHARGDLTFTLQPGPGNRAGRR